jgi:type IV secretory pathway TrbD component
MADKAAGQMMGKLLAVLFCVLLFLMTGVNIWMLTHASTIKDTDPQAFAYGNTAGEHAAEGHH